MRIFIRICLIIFVVLLWNNARVVFAQEQQPLAKPTQEAQKAAAQGAPQAPQAGQQAEPTAPSVPPIIQIKPLEGQENIYSFELRNVEIGDLFRVLAHDYKLNLLVDKDIQGQVTASLSNVTLEEALSTIAESQNLLLEKKGNIIKVSPNLITKTFILKYIEAQKTLEPSGAGAAAGQQAAGAVTQPQAQPGQVQQVAGGVAAGVVRQTSTIYDLLSDKGKVLLGTQPNSITVIDYPANVEKIEEYLRVIDQKMNTRVFKLKYLKAADVLGIAEVTSSASQSAATTGTTSTSGTRTATTR